MLNKLYGWLVPPWGSPETGGDSGSDPAGTGTGTSSDPGTWLNSRKRPLGSIQDSNQSDGHDSKRFKMGDLVDSMKSAAEGVKQSTSSMMMWMKNKSPDLSSMFIAQPSSLLQRRPALGETVLSKNQASLDAPGALGESFIHPTREPLWKYRLHQEALRSERQNASGDHKMPSKMAKKIQMEANTTNGHSRSAVLSTVSLPQKPKLGRSLHLEKSKTPSGMLNSNVGKSGSQEYMSVYEKMFPIKAVSSPSRKSMSCTSCFGLQRRRRKCSSAVEETFQQEEKEVYRQLLHIVTGNSFRVYSPVSAIQSHRDLRFLSLKKYSFQKVISDDEQSLEGQSTSLSFDLESSQVSSAITSPAQMSSKTASPSPASGHLLNMGNALGSGDLASQILQDNLDGQSTASDSDSVIVVKVKDATEPKNRSLSIFQGELWIKELTSLYDSRARERQRQIEEQEALTLRLQKQRLEDQGYSPKDSIDLHLRVPLENEAPVTALPEEEKDDDKVRKEKVEKEFPELTEEMEEDIRRAFRSGHQDEVLSDAFRLTITRKDIQTLNHLNWLNDEIINFYMNLLVERSKEKGMPKVHAFNTFFFPKLKMSGFQAVKRWTKKVDIFQMSLLLVPVHLGVHWCLAVVDFRSKTIAYYDSMGGNNTEACKILLQYLKQESLDKKKQVFDETGWKLTSKKSQEIPQQMNGSDCGMFTCKYADYITKDKAITFTQQHMPYFRRRMVWEILHRKLL
nr:PREDICTED: sentrin-specific protease 1 isoform X2 [Latimeria chalumnae]|eukprot:XP_014340292.1 PREDICTED: sentrin-specific protease 1 isoform X2 [Latimeria chalumnae]